jgi:two-component system, chemotaxis family, protein-glutamate methylesterase/glutaminase
MTIGARGQDDLPLVVVGASAGGVEALRQFVAGLPVDLGAAVLVVLHVPADAPSALPRILARVSGLPVSPAVAGRRLEAGTVLVAPPNQHLMVIDGEVALSSGPQENGHRPAVDVLFRSAARVAGPRTIGVVLSGSLDDGAAGAVAIASRGGRIMVQDRAEALYSSMPDAAARAAHADARLTAGSMGSVLAQWLDAHDSAVVVAPADTSQAASETMRMEVEMADLDPAAVHEPERPGIPAGFGCPDCGGALFQIDEGGLRRYRCRVGHAWSPESLLAEQTSAMEGALWMALRSLEEKAALSTDLARRARSSGHDLTATRFDEHAQETLGAAELVRRLIDEIGTPAHEPEMH